ncbi:MAG TPA: hypothetical protein VGH92_01400 [Gaiellaceae bacterium]|jgi:hypothetical protein
MRRIVTAVVSVAALSLLAAGCGGGGGNPGVANGASSGTAQTGLVAYARCMRSHRVPGFPDPTSSGGIDKREVVAARQSNPSAFDSASNACASLLPGGSLGPSSPHLTAADRADYLKAAACMRTHGYPSFPDPTFQDDEARVSVPSRIDQSSPQFRRAATMCTKLIPRGLPYSRPSGS